MKGDQAAGLRRGTATRAAGLAVAAGSESLVAVVSGKGGVGKTNLVANLAIAAAGLGARVLIVDGDLGLANVDVLLGLVSQLTVEDVLSDRCSLVDALMEGPRGVRILPAASGRAQLAALPVGELAGLVRQLREAAADFDLVLVDAGAGIGPSVVGLASSCARALVLTNPEPTSLANAYATLKVLLRGAPWLRLEVVVNEADSELQARATHSRLERMAKRFLDAEVGFRGFLPRDRRLEEAVARQRAVVELFPTAASSRRLVELAQGLLRDHARGAERPQSIRSSLARGIGTATCIRN